LTITKVAEMQRAIDEVLAMNIQMEETAKATQNAFVDAYTKLFEVTGQDERAN